MSKPFKGDSPSPREVFLGLKLIPLSRSLAQCVVCTLDRPFLLSRVAGNFTIHDCNILEAEINVREGVVTDLYKIETPPKIEFPDLEKMLFESLRKILLGRINLEKEIYLWEKEHHVIRDELEAEFQSLKGNRAVLAINTSNKQGLLHKISWALSLAGLNIDKALFSSTEDNKGEDVFWISQRHGQRINLEYQALVLELLKLIVSEGQDPLEQSFRKELNMIYRQQLRRHGGGFRTARLYADVHLRLVGELLARVKAELNLEGSPILVGIFGGIGSGAIGFTSDIDFFFLYDGPWREEYDSLKRIFQRRLEIITGLDVDETFLQYHLNYFFLNRPEGGRPVSFEDFFGYVRHIQEIKRKAGGRLSMPQFFHFPWIFSARFIGGPEVLERFNARLKTLPARKGRTYSSLKAYLLGEMGEEIRGDYLDYLEGRFNREELGFLEAEELTRLYRDKEYARFIDAISPYEAIKYIFRRGVFPLLHLAHHRRRRTDMGLLKKEYRSLRPALDFMLKSFNVRKTLFIMGWWDLNYFLFIMNCRTPRRFCELYLKHQQALVSFTRDLIARAGEGVRD